MNFNNNLLNHSYNNINFINRNGNRLNQMQMMNMYQTSANLKKMQQSNIYSKINELEKNRDRLQLDENELRNAIICPIKVEKCDEREIVIKYKDLKKNFTDKELKQLWDKRTNQAYKNIIKDEKFQNKEFKKQEDLIVHRVTNLDKEGVEDELKEFQNKLEKQNGELKIQYSQSNELEHKKKFEYNNKYKYVSIYNPKDHGNLRNDNIEYFKEQQEKQEKDKKKIDDILQDLLNSNILTDDERKELISVQDDTANNKNNTDGINNNIKHDTDKQVKNQPIKISVISTTKKITSDNNTSNSNTSNSNITNNNTSSNNITNNITNNKTNEISTNVSDDVRSKYLNRKKK